MVECCLTTTAARRYCRRVMVLLVVVVLVVVGLEVPMVVWCSLEDLLVVVLVVAVYLR